MWRAIGNWVLAGCLSASALNFSASQGLEGVVSELDRAEVGDAEDQAGLTSERVAQPTANQAISSSSAVPAPPNEQSMASPVSTAPSNVNQETASPTGTQEYRIQPEDVLQITVYEEPDLSTKARVTGSGEINFPLLGRIQVAGQTMLEVQEEIEVLLEKDYLVNPQVQVFIISYHARSVFVTGAVTRPGSYSLPLGRPTTLMEAVSIAGGFTEEAAPNNTRIVRIDSGKETTIHVRANDIIKKGDKTKDVEVRPNDVIFVPESFF